jgi:mRNA-degrading endonuclease RelE of RelBE toxin-antitoxin system
MEFVEVPAFTSRVLRYLDDESYAELQNHLAHYPNAGAIIPGSKGLRKIRWAAKGRGKRGGTRVIYFWHVTPEIITFLDIYPKNEKDDLTKQEIRLLNQLLDD